MSATPGVGKTAVVEGLALKIVEGGVPAALTGTRIVGLDMGRLQAGSGVKGEFEKRLKGVIDEVKAAATPTILFIDEAHTLVGSGNAAGKRRRGQSAQARPGSRRTAHRGRHHLERIQKVF